MKKIRLACVAAGLLTSVAVSLFWVAPRLQAPPTRIVVEEVPAGAAARGSTDTLEADEAPEVEPGGPRADAAEASPSPGKLVEQDGPLEPPLISTNTNLSYARRAGLQRAADPLRLTASVALAIDAKTHETLYAKNEQAILPIASLTKLMMGMVLLDSGVAMNARLTIKSDDVDLLRHSRSRLPVGASIQRRQALRIALMSSENRAAHALARSQPGGLDDFVNAMNLKAQALGMTHSRFVDPTGLSNRNRAPAVDVARLVEAASKYPVLRAYSTTKRWTIRVADKTLRYLNSNRLVRVSGWPARLQKTGYVVEAGFCTVLSMLVQRRDVILVLLDAGSVADRGRDATRLRDWLNRRLRGDTRVR
ncbi:MAG: peptidase S11 [Gammaproteobacteria bacterium]|nr:peptidase S11 [Gammaproteobacteria bacterium]